MGSNIKDPLDVIRPVNSDDDVSEIPERRRVIRYLDNEEQDDIEARPGPSRRRSRSRSLSRAGSRRRNSSASTVDRLRSRTVDPSTVLPIEYRTVSFHIEDTKDYHGHLEPQKSEERPQSAKKAESSREVAADLGDLTWHRLSVEQVCQNLDTSINDGLSDTRVKEAVVKYGRNVPAKPSSQLPRKLFGYCFGNFGSLLLVGCILVFIAWKPLGNPNPAIANLALAIVLAAVFVIQAGFNAWQDFSTSRIMDSITGMLPEGCTLIRNGVQTIVQAPDVVPGDVMLVKAGAKLSADVRFVEISADTRFDRSILTGESFPIQATVNSTDNNYLETKCIGLQGTHCVTGACKAVVVSTANDTVFGRIASLTNKPDIRPTQLQKDILRLVYIIISLAAFFIVIVAIVWGAYVHKEHPDYIGVAALIVSLVSVGIAFVPEGLPIAMTASLTIVANIMKRENVLCKSLKTVETLGSVNVICSDKTGTLTCNKMTVTHCTVGTSVLTPEEASSEIYAGESRNVAAVRRIRTIAALCNAGEFDVTTKDKPLSERTILGDATDQAVLRFAESLGPHEHERRQWRKDFDIPFNSKNKFMIRIYSPRHDSDAGGDSFLSVKGAPDILLRRCDTILGNNGEVSPLDRAKVEDMTRIKDEWSAAGKRVILLAQKSIAPSEFTLDEDTIMDCASTGLTLVGLLGIVDPPRPEIPEVIRTLRQAGIRMFMVTGDFKLTAIAIARMCGIVTTHGEIADASALARDDRISGYTSQESHDSVEKGVPKKVIALSGSELQTLDADQWCRLCTYDEIVFARTTPEQKLRIVEEFQRQLNVVAMTGDGVNDAPSLKAANVGVAIQGGSDIAIEAADMVLLDSFSGIVQAVLYGRVIFDNLKKTIIYLLPAGSFSEVWPVITNVVFGLPQILSSFLMIMICCLTDCGAAMALALEKPEADLLLRPPRNIRKDKLVDWRLLLQAYGIIGLIECTTSFAMAYWNAQRRGVHFSVLWFGYGSYGELDSDYVAEVLNQCSSIYFVNLVIMQWFNLLAIRTRRLSLLQHPPIFRKATQNLALFPAILFAFVMIFIFNYIPSLQSAIGSMNVPAEYFFFPVAFGLVLLIMDEARKWTVRKYPHGVLAKVAW